MVTYKNAKQAACISWPIFAEFLAATAWSPQLVQAKQALLQLNNNKAG